MDSLVWVEGYQVEDFSVGQEVTWPMTRLRKAGTLAEIVGDDIAAQVEMGPDWYALRPEDTIDYNGTVVHIESFRCRHAQSRVVPGSVLKRPVTEAVFGGLNEDVTYSPGGVNFVGYLVTVSRLIPIGGVEVGV